MRRRRNRPPVGRGKHIYTTHVVPGLDKQVRPVSTKRKKPTTQQNRTKITIEVLLSAAAIAIGSVVGLDQLQDHRGLTASTLIVGTVLVAFALFFVSIWRRARTRTFVRRLLASTAVTLLVTSIGILALTSPDASQNKTPTLKSPSPASQQRLDLLVTVPDEHGRCEAAGMITAPGIASTSPTPGSFAITPGTQISVLLQAPEASKIVVTHIRTIVDGRQPTSFVGKFVDLTPDCQGEPDERYYTADFAQAASDVRPGTHASTLPPITVASDDPVLVYLTMPNIQGVVTWHLQATWALNGKETTTDVFYNGGSILTSSR